MPGVTGFDSSISIEPLEEAVPWVGRLDFGLVNAYLVGAPGGPWALLDTSLPLSAALTRRAAAKRYGEGARP